jgi:hypothetical protein
MRRTLVITMSVVGFLAVAATGAVAQSRCLLDGVEYPENASVCSAGLVLFCANGTWQNNEGARCDAQSGSYLGARRPLEERNAEPVPDFYKEKYPALNLQ